jgi:glycosyltransferase involved in cell wall biosynthesis
MDDFELIVLDNSSSDGTSGFMESFCDSRVKYHRHEPMGISSQRNLGLSMATTNFIAFLDDDDVWLPNKLEEQLSVITQSGANTSLVYGGFRFYDDSGRRWGDHLPTLTGYVLTGLLWTRNPFSGSASNPLINRRFALAVGGYDNRVLVGEDWELYLRLAERYEVAGVQKVLLEIRQHDGPRLGQRLDAALTTDYHVYRRFRAKMSSELRSRYLQKIGGKYIRLGNRPRGRTLIAASLKTYPWNVLAWVQFALSSFNSPTYRQFHRLYHRFFRRW